MDSSDRSSSEFAIRIVAFLILLTSGISPALAEFDDTVYLKNGDRVKGDVKELSQHMLRFKTDSMGTVNIRWGDIEALETTRWLRIELTSGRILVGRLLRSQTPQMLLVSTTRGTEPHHFEDLVAFVPLRLQRAWLDRIEGEIEFGLSGTKGSNTVQWHVGAEALYRGEKFEFRTNLDSIFTKNKDDTHSERVNFNNSYRRLLGNRWFWTVLGRYERNDELGILNRYSAGGGAGRFLYRSTSFELVAQGGLLASREFRTTDISNQVEAYVGGSLAWFRHYFPEMDIKTTGIVFPSLTESGRFRSEWDLSIRRELIEDLSISLSLYYSTDNKAPDESARDDWGILTSVAYSF